MDIEQVKQAKDEVFNQTKNYVEKYSHLLKCVGISAGTSIVSILIYHFGWNSKKINEVLNLIQESLNKISQQQESIKSVSDTNTKVVEALTKNGLLVANKTDQYATEKMRKLIQSIAAANSYKSSHDGLQADSQEIGSTEKSTSDVSIVMKGE